MKTEGYIILGALLFGAGLLLFFFMPKSKPTTPPSASPPPATNAAASVGAAAAAAAGIADSSNTDLSKQFNLPITTAVDSTGVVINTHL